MTQTIANPEVIQRIHRAATSSVYADGSNREVFTVKNAIGSQYYVKLMPIDDKDYGTMVQYKSVNAGTLWDIIPADEFCRMYLSEVKLKPYGFTTTFNEISKMKSVKFFNKNGKIMWFDSEGYFYIANKTDSPTKKKTDIFKKYGGNRDAVYVRITEYGKSTYSWFNSLREANEEFDKVFRRRNAAFETPTMKLLTSGDKIVDPKNVKTIYRLPYFDINNSLKFNGVGDDKAGCINRTALEWHKEIIRQGSNSDLNELIKIITAYCDYTEKTKENK